MKAAIKPQVLTDGSIVFDVVADGVVIATPATQAEAEAYCLRFNHGIVASHSMEAAMQILHGGLFDGTGKLPTAESVAAIVEQYAMPSKLIAALKSLIEAFDTLADRQGDAGITQKEARIYNEAKQALKSTLPVS